MFRARRVDIESGAGDMHNCKSTRNNLTDLALHELPPDQQKQMLAELQECAACNEEYVSIRDTLIVSGQALRSTLPGTEFWDGYHARLAARLEHQPQVSPATSQGQSPWQVVWSMVTASVRIPVPVFAAMLLLLFGVGTSLAWSLMKKTNVAVEPQVITRTVTVSVPEEKIITRVVYRPRNNFRVRSRSSQFDLSYQPQLGSAQAQTGLDSAEKAPISLVGFKPTEQVKLKVMKGSYRDEK